MNMIGMVFSCERIPSRQRCLYTFLFLTVAVYITGYLPGNNLLGIVKWYKSESSTTVNTIPCLPKKNIVFLKTHKCASSSVQNILMRYAYRRNLTLMLPISPKLHYFSPEKHFKSEMVTGSPWGNSGYNILCHHLVFNKTAIQKLMPKDSLYISILRSPVALFESLYEYNKFQDFYHMDIEEYAHSTKNNSIIAKLRRRKGGMGRNQMLFDFGVHPAFFNNKAIIKRAIENIELNFDFIMITEYFDESIVLLRHLLCWDLDDVISLTINARMDTYKKNLSEVAIKNLEEWNWGDNMLYQHFLSIFNSAIKEFGKEKLQIEVQELRNRRNEWFEYCVQKKVGAKNLTSYKIWSDKVTGYALKYQINNKTCEDLVKPENYFTSEIRQHQLVQSLMKGAVGLNHGPLSLQRLFDLKFLKEKELYFAKKLLSKNSTEYFYKKRKSS